LAQSRAEPIVAHRRTPSLNHPHGYGLKILTTV
jgi:hypothetical protein